MKQTTALSVIGSTTVSKTVSKGSNPLEFGKTNLPQIVVGNNDIHNENKHTVKSSNVLTALTTGNLKSIRNNARMNGFRKGFSLFLLITIKGL